MALAPGLDPGVAERFSSMFMLLTRKKHYLRPIKDLTLDWRPLFKELKLFVLPQESGMVHNTNVKRNIRTLTKLSAFAQLYFDPRDMPAMFAEFMPYFSTSFAEGAYVVVGLLNLLLPTSPPPVDDDRLQPQHYLPTLFHLWSLVARSKTFDVVFLDLLSRLARDSLTAEHVPFSAHGIFSSEQSSLIFTATLRLLEIPVGQASSPYSATVDLSAGLAVLLDKEQRKHPVSHHIARWIVMSLSPASLDGSESIMAKLEGLVQAVETFFHPSNSGGWTKTLSQLVFFLVDFFVMRWNRERSGELEVPEDRRLDEPLRRRFVLCLRDVTFMGIYAKSTTAMTFSLSALQGLAFLEPALILPGALQRIYPAMQGLVEVHRTTSSLRSLQALSLTLVRTPGFRCHVTTLLGLALPGIDANDLDKTLYSMSFIQAVCYAVPLHDLTKGRDDIQGSALAATWITAEMERMELEGAAVELDYASTLSAEDEAMILRSSTASIDEFLISLLTRVFTVLENLPDESQVRSGSPEENFINTLSVTFTPLLASLSPELFDLALAKVADFVAARVIHQARDGVAFICNALCKVNPEKAHKRLIPMLIRAIRTEIDENGAASTRTTGAEVLGRDRPLVWNVSVLSMCVVHSGASVLRYKDDLFDLADYMQKRCKGIPTVHVYNFMHHLLLNLTATYTLDYSPYEPDVIARGVRIEDWGRSAKASELTIKWHVPDRDEIEFAVRLFRSQAESALANLASLTSDSSPIPRDGSGKEWSDEVSQSLMLLRLILSGVSSLFDPKVYAAGISGASAADGDDDVDMSGTNGHAVGDEAADEARETDRILSETDEDDVKPTFPCAAGYPLAADDPLYAVMRDLRSRTGELLHHVHEFLTEKQGDDYSCFNALYTVYSSWFLDVGIERSAQVLDRTTRLLSADIHPYKVSGLRKDYPRPLLLRRANVYHLQRLRYNAVPRKQSDLDRRLLLDLAESAVSLYTDIRRHAQSAGESAIKVILGARPLVIPPLLAALERAIEANDYPRIKGAMYALLFGSLAKTVGRDWRFAPSVIRSFIAVSTVDRPSLQTLAAGATYQVMDYGRPLERMVLLDPEVVGALAPTEPVEDRVASKREKVQKKRARVETQKSALALELVELAKKSHWRKASRTAAILVSLGLRFDSIASEEMVELVAMGTIDSHPGLRGLYSGAFVALFSLVEMRACCGHDYQSYLLDKQLLPTKVHVETRRDDPNWTEDFLAAFARPTTEHFVDHDYPGWLVWGKTMPAYVASPKDGVRYDERELGVRAHVGRLLTRQWFSTLFGYLKQEPRDSSADRFRMASVMMLVYAFNLVLSGVATATFSDIKELVEGVYEDGSDKHMHRATAEIMGALLTAVVDEPIEKRDEVWAYAWPVVRGVFDDGLTPENQGYWTTFLRLILQGKDPRRSWPVVEWLAKFRLDTTSNAAFKESSKIELLQQCVADTGWHFQLEAGVVEDFLAHLDHPYKGVREAMGQTLGGIYRTRYHESYRDLDSLFAAQKEASSVGVRPYAPTPAFANTVRDIFKRLARWRDERTPGQQTPSSYTSGSKTVLLWLDSTVTSHECTQLVDFFPDVFLEELLLMMDVHEDPELQQLAYHVFRHMPNVPHRAGEDRAFINALVRIGKTSALWHQRLRVLLNMQVIYFRHLFLMGRDEQRALFDCVSSMLKDAQLEVRLGAATTLSGMIRCSPASLRDEVVPRLKRDFLRMLRETPMPRRAGGGTPTPEHTGIVNTRHAAVLGLGALVQAFPYVSPPPTWLPEILATLAVKAAGDPGTVGKSVKTILGDFKKTRQDTWHADVKVFTPEQLEDLEGVLWKSYFA